MTVHDQDVAYAGTVRVEAELDLADALDLDHAVRLGAESLRALGSEAPLDSRRAEALGDLVRRQLALDLRSPGRRRRRHAPPAGSTSTSTSRAVATDDRRGRARRAGPARGGPAPGPARPGQAVVRRQPHAGRGPPGPRPRRTAERAGYAVPDRLREQVVQRDRTCLFPWCSRPARRCQVDHVVPYDHADPEAGRPDRVRQPRRALHPPPPAQDPRRLDLRHARARRRRLALTAWPPLPARPHRHRSRCRTRPADDDPAPDPADQLTVGPSARPHLPVFAGRPARRPRTGQSVQPVHGRHSVRHAHPPGRCRRHPRHRGPRSPRRPKTSTS